MTTRISQWKKLGTGVFVLVTFLMASSVSGQTWHSAGLTGGDVRSLASDPRNPKFVYLGTTDGHIFGSSDTGESWRLLGLAGNSKAVVTALIVDPRRSGQIYASTWTREAGGEGGGVFISRDGGVTWGESGLRSHAVRALAQAAANPDVLVAGALDGVFVSYDAGQNWERVTPSGDKELRNFDSLAIDPANPEIIYAGTFHLPWKTADGGKHWQPVHTGMIDDSDVLSIAIDATDSQRVFASACSGIYRSGTAGAAWEKVEGIPYSSRRTLVIRQDPAQPSSLYAGTTEGLWKSNDAGKTWRRISPSDWVINSMALQPAYDSGQPSRLLLGTERQGIMASNDGGASFHAGNDGFHHRRILSVAVDSANPMSVVAVVANAPETVVVSADGGASWIAMDKGLGPDGVRSIFSVLGGWWAALPSGGLARYDDAARTWVRTGVFREGSAAPNGATGSSLMVVRPVVNDMHFSAASWFAATQQGLFESGDQGKTWSSLRFSPAELPVESVRVSKEGRSIRIVSSRGMVFSDDAGQSWRWHDLPLESGGAKKLEWADESTLLAVARTGVYISQDSGTTWKKEQAGLPSAFAQELLIRPGLWLASMESAGLYASRNEGASWTRVKSAEANSALEIAESEFPVLAGTGATERVFVGSASEGLYLLEFDRILNAATQVANMEASGH